ncbi:hypothetical protein ACQ4PT_027611 [Festuca glaucescens]
MDIHQHDLVSFGPGLHDCGAVEGLEAEATAEDNVRTFKIIRFDNSLLIKKASDLTVIDRSYLNIADVVASASDPGGQIGVVTGATTTLDLVRTDERDEVAEAAVSSVPASRLRRARALGLGDLVVSGPWLGQVSEVRVDADMSFDDGALCTVADAESKSRFLELLTAHGVILCQKNSFFCPGQRVRSCCSSVFKDARWLRGQWNADRDVATIVKVEMSGVLVHWIASRHCGTDPLLLEALAPPAYQNPHDLTFFWVAYNNMGWGPADHCFFTEPGSTHGGSDFAHDRQLAEDQYDMTDDHREAHNKDDEQVPELPSGKCHLQGGHMDKLELLMTVAKTQTYVDVLWQDGTRQSGIPSKSMVPFNITNDHEFLPGDHVLDNPASLDGATASTINDDDIAPDVTKPARRAGIVRTVCCKDQTVNVSWFKAAACPNEAREVECNDTVSTYSLQRESGDSPNLGCIVVRLLPSSWSEMKKNVSPADLSWVGHVIDHPDGHVQVKWGDGSISTVFPHEIVIPRQEDYMVRNHETDEDSSTGDDETDEDSSTDDDEEPTVANTDNDLVNPAEDGDAGSDSAATSTYRLTSFIRYFLRLAGEVLAPETIYVRAFEDRMDLLRAVMVGASGTPYEDGIFFFDLYLPPSYPAVPPQVYYHSFGLRLNPNLYESGTVCLSLLDTFDGEGTEVWSPETSSLLQVLVSIQGLVLNDQPYYNEAGYERQVGTPAGRRNALPYRENAYLLTLRTMLYLLRRPPQGFEVFVKDHFGRRGRFVLGTCEAYLQGCVDGMHMEDDNATEAGKEWPCSAGLKLALVNMVPSLRTAFKELGANGCEVFQKLRVPLPRSLSTTH